MKTTCNKKKLGRPRDAATDAIADSGGYTKRQARNILAEADASGVSVDDLKAARLRKTKLEGDRIEYLLEVTKGKHIAKDKVQEEGIALGMAVKAQLLAWTGALPGRIEGLSAGQMVPIFEAEVSRVLKTLSEMKF